MTLLRNLRVVLQRAMNEGYAVGAFNIINLEFLEAVIAAAKWKQAPVILNIAEIHLPYINLEYLVYLVKEIAAREKLEIVLNLDHGQSMNVIRRCLDLGFTSVMYDGSHLSLAENIRHTREVVAICRAADVSVEAELGAVGGSEGGDLLGFADPDRFTDVVESQYFVKETGIDALAVAIGNAHGQYHGAPQLDFVRLQQIKEATAIPLVLHGGSGLSADDFKKAIRFGICKVNFFTGMSQAALQTMRDFLFNNGQKYNEYVEMVARVKENVSEVVAGQIDIFGSSGKMCLK